jgi:16S rRNA (cytosine967-C5)-methyltransferase
MIFDNQLRHALHIIETYQGDMPLHSWLKDFFRLNKQMGSRDRKLLSSLAYSFYRLGHAARELPVKDRLLLGLYLCNGPSDFLAYFRPDWPQNIPLAARIGLLQFTPTDIFPWKDELSPTLDHEKFCLSFLTQPDLFIRIRPGHEEIVRRKLDGIGEFIAPSTCRLPNGFKVEEYFTPDREVVIQDYSSQQLAQFLKPAEFFWDACAASGGKSILMHDLYPNSDITVSDIRESILKNLKSRFKTAGIEKYRAFIADLTRQAPPASAANADLILADVPCTGSGTWGRTPEELYFFEPKKIARYSSVQQSILKNIAPHLAPDAALVYCTCSVFKKENEAITDLLQNSFGLRLQSRENLIGYDKHADTLFAARFTR